jgi:hypothetical protein
VAGVAGRGIERRISGRSMISAQGSTANRLYAVVGHSRGPVVPATLTTSAQHFFDRRNPAGPGGTISGIPLALGRSDQTVGFSHAAFPSRHADLMAVDLVG